MLPPITARYLKFTTESSGLRQQLAAFVADYVGGTTVHPFTPQYRIHQHAVILDVYAWDSSINLALIQTLAPERGFASLTLDWLIELADRHGVTITGVVYRVGTKGMYKSSLMAWYRRHGFVVRSGGDLTYTPKEQPR